MKVETIVHIYNILSNDVAAKESLHNAKKKEYGERRANYMATHPDTSTWDEEVHAVLKQCKDDWDAAYDQYLKAAKSFEDFADEDWYTR